MTGGVEALLLPLLQAAADTAGGAGGDTALLPFGDVVAREGLAAFLRAGFYVLIGIPLLIVGARSLRRWFIRRGEAQQGMVMGKLLFYSGFALLVVMVLWELGFGLGPLLGAAGILGIAIGFASQTSVSNVISGIFLMAEQPFRVDDVIQIGNTVGRVLSIDTISVKLRTFDNKFVRIPNESIVKSEVTNITRFPIRRLDVNVGVAYKEDIGRVREVLLEVADRNPLALMEPKPMVIVEGYGESSIDFRFAVWAARENWLALKNSIQEEVKVRFDEDGIEIPFPHRTLYAGLATRPFPVRVVDDPDEAGGHAGGPPAPAPDPPGIDPTDPATDPTDPDPGPGDRPSDFDSPPGSDTLQP